MTKEEARAKLHVEIATEVMQLCKKEGKVTAMEGTAVFLSLLTERLADLQLRVDQLERDNESAVFYPLPGSSKL